MKLLSSEDVAITTPLSRLSIHAQIYSVVKRKIKLSNVRNVSNKSWEITSKTSYISAIPIFAIRDNKHWRDELRK